MCWDSGKRLGGKVMAVAARQALVPQAAWGAVPSSLTDQQCDLGQVT